MVEQFFRQQDFSGGLSDSDLFGVSGSLAEGVGVNIHDTPKVLKVSQALKKESGTTVTDFCKFKINCSDGNSYWFGDTGKIYKRTSLGVWSNVHTNTNGANVGAYEFDSYIYYASATKLGRISIAAAGSESPWSSQNDSWQTLTSATYHPMIVQGLYLFIGNDRVVSSVDDAGTFTTSGTPSVTFYTLPHNHSITAMINFGLDFLVGTRVSTTRDSARIFRWDFSYPSWLLDDDLPEIGVNCFIPIDNYVFVQAGNQGNIYYYDGSFVEKSKKIKGDYSNKTMTAYPDSVSSFLGIPIFGVSNLSSNPCNQGVYSLGQYDRNYPIALMLQYVISQNKTSSIEIGAILGLGTNLLVAWKDGSTYGVDNIDWNNKYTSAYVKTLVLGGDRQSSKTFLENIIGYKQKPAGTDITLSYYKNFSASDTAMTLRDESDYNKLIGQDNFEAGVSQFKIAFTVSSNDAPEIDLLYFKWNAREVL